MYGVNKRMFSVLIVKLLLKNKADNFFEQMEIAVTIYEGVVGPSFKKY